MKVQCPEYKLSPEKNEGMYQRGESIGDITTKRTKQSPKRSDTNESTTDIPRIIHHNYKNGAYLVKYKKDTRVEKNIMKFKGASRVGLPSNEDSETECILVDRNIYQSIKETFPGEVGPLRTEMCYDSLSPHPAIEITDLTQNGKYDVTVH